MMTTKDDVSLSRKKPRSSRSSTGGIDLHEELRSLVRALNGEGIDYALCGGLAMAVHGLPRATADIDILVQKKCLPKAKRLAAKLGFDVEARPMRFSEGAVTVHRLSKVEPETGDVLSLDFLPVTAALLPAWKSRRDLRWEGEPLWVVGREGLIEMKALRGSGQDKDDIRYLKGLSDES